MEVSLRTIRRPLISCLRNYRSLRTSPSPAPAPRRSFSSMPSTTLSTPRHISPIVMYNDKDASSYDDRAFLAPQEQDPMLFDLDDVPYGHDSVAIGMPWTNAYPDHDQDSKGIYTGAFGSPMYMTPSYELGQQSSPTESYYDSSFYTPEGSNSSPAAFNSDLFLSPWLNDPVEPAAASASSPIPIPTSPLDSHSHHFVPYVESPPFPMESAFSPTEYAAMHPLPASSPPSATMEERMLAHRSRQDSIQSDSGPLNVPAWATQLFDGKNVPPSSPRRPSPLSEGVQRRHINILGRRGSIPSGQLFHHSGASASAASFSPQSAPTGSGMIRSYSRKAEPTVSMDDRDATVRRRRKTSAPDQPDRTEKATEGTPLKSALKPPKLAPSAWQLYFTDWIQRQQASNTRKLNVAQAAKEAGQEYASLSAEEKEPYKRRSQAMKEARERDLEAYMRTLTPEDIKRENAFRAAQRKAGKSRKSNIKDPNAPKKPLSAYFMFLQRIRADPQMVQDVFGDETETTKQSVLAAAKWRSMTDDERKPFLAQAEQEKMEYETARRLYEEGPSGSFSTFNFSILQGSPGFSTLKIESESESEGLATDHINPKRFS